MFGRSPKPVKIHLFAKTDLGKTRDHNEDKYLVADLTRRVNTLTPGIKEHDLGERGSVLMIADGMGGAAAGEVASEMATDSVYAHLEQAWLGEKEVTAQRFAYRL